MNRLPNRLLIVSTNFNGFNLANHGSFTTFAKLSPCQIFLLHSTSDLTKRIVYIICIVERVAVW